MSRETKQVVEIFNYLSLVKFTFSDTAIKALSESSEIGSLLVSLK